MPRSFFVLDIDGTLVPEGSETIREDVRRAICRIRAHHEECIASNGKDEGRKKRIADALSARYACGTKPFSEVIAQIRAMNADRLPFVVVGDRYLTDGLLALRLAAKFIPVLPLREAGEPWRTRLSYAFHECIAILVSAIISLIRRP